MTWCLLGRATRLLTVSTTLQTLHRSTLSTGVERLLRRMDMSEEVKAEIARKHFGFLGSGVMAQAMVKGFLASAAMEKSQVTMADLYAGAFPDVAKYPLEFTGDNLMMATKSDVIFVCVKPHIVVQSLKELGDSLSGKLVISVAAGVTLDQLTQAVPGSARVLRIMPNTPCIVRAGTGLMACAPSVREEDKSLVKTLCSSIFTVFEEMPESMLAVASAISGCGPAFIYIIAEALADGGVLVGVPRQMAEKLAINTILGAAAMMQHTGENPSTLKNQVCSPGGTTIAGVHALESGNLRAALMNAVQAATRRNEELSRKEEKH